MEIKLGSTVTDVTTGFTGTATSRNEMFNGNVQYAVTPKSKDGLTMSEPYAIDVAQLKVKAKGVSNIAVDPQPHDFKIGQEVECILSGFKGCISGITTFLNGCVYVEIVKPANEAKKTEAQNMFVSTARVRHVGDGVMKKMTPKPAKATGGPSTRAMRAC